MSGKLENAACYPCHIYGIRDAKDAEKENLNVERVRDYGARTKLEDGTVLHDNWPAWHDEGGRYLLRCTVCGALRLMQCSMAECPFGDWDEPDEYYRDYVPVATVEEADLLNILWDEKELKQYPFRRFSRHDFSRGWTEGEEPCPYDAEELRKRIREKYAGLKKEQKELLEKLIRKAGK